MTLPRGPIDVEAILVGLADDADTVLTGNVSTELPLNYPYPSGRLTLLPGGGQADGSHEDHRLNRDRIQVETWGDPAQGSRGKGEARDAIDALLEVLINAAGDYGARGVITGVILESSPYWLPDPSDDSPRYVAAVAVYSHPA